MRLSKMPEIVCVWGEKKEVRAANFYKTSKSESYSGCSSSPPGILITCGGRN